MSKIMGSLKVQTQGGQWSNHPDPITVVLLVFCVCSSKKGRTQQADALHSLAEAHLVSQNAVLVLVPRVDEPVEAIQLVIPESACFQEVRLTLQGPVLELAPGHVRGTCGL